MQTLNHLDNPPNTTTPTVVKPFLKWPGAKTRLTPRIIQEIKQFEPTRIIEPFAGSGAVSLNFFTSIGGRAYLADVNPDLHAVFKFLKSDNGRFIGDCKALFTPANNTAEQYYKLREKFNSTNDARERAVLFVYLNRHGFNGLCRYSQTGKYNVPFGSYSKPYFPWNEMQQFYRLLKKSKLTQSDFASVMRQATQGDLVYCDPPYLPHGEDGFTQYATGGFGWEDQCRLATAARKLAAKGIPVIISNHDTPQSRQLYEGAIIHSFEVKRTISCNGKGRQPALELLAIFSPAA